MSLICNFWHIRILNFRSDIAKTDFFSGKISFSQIKKMAKNHRSIFW